MSVYVRYNTWWGGTRVVCEPSDHVKTVDMSFAQPIRKKIARKIAKRLAS